MPSIYCVLSLCAGSPLLEIGMKLLQIIITKLPAEEVYIKHPTELAIMVSLYVLGYYDASMIVIYACRLTF